jgi:anti-sigma factor RsiW
LVGVVNDEGDDQGERDTCGKVHADRSTLAQVGVRAANPNWLRKLAGRAGRAKSRRPSLLGQLSWWGRHAPLPNAATLLERDSSS